MHNYHVNKDAPADFKKRTVGRLPRTNLHKAHLLAPEVEKAFGLDALAHPLLATSSGPGQDLERKKEGGGLSLSVACCALELGSKLTREGGVGGAAAHPDRFYAMNDTQSKGRRAAHAPR